LTKRASFQTRDHETPSGGREDVHHGDSLDHQKYATEFPAE